MRRSKPSISLYDGMAKVLAHLIEVGRPHDLNRNGQGHRFALLHICPSLQCHGSLQPTNPSTRPKNEVGRLRPPSSKAVSSCMASYAAKCPRLAGWHSPVHEEALHVQHPPSQLDESRIQRQSRMDKQHSTEVEICFAFGQGFSGKTVSLAVCSFRSAPLGGVSRL